MAVKFQNILVPLDGSTLAESALPLACDLARRYQARLWLYRVRVRPPSVWEAQEPEAMEAFSAQEKRVCDDYLQGLREALGEEAPPQVELLHEFGNPAEAILEKAEDLPGALIVMTSHGRDGLRRWLMGSVAEKVARHASCPVMLLREGKLK